jgi:hypothetical protein
MTHLSQLVSRVEVRPVGPPITLCCQVSLWQGSSLQNQLSGQLCWSRRSRTALTPWLCFLLLSIRWLKTWYSWASFQDLTAYQAGFVSHRVKQARAPACPRHTGVTALSFSSPSGKSYCHLTFRPCSHQIHNHLQLSPPNRKILHFFIFGRGGMPKQEEISRPLPLQHLVHKLAQQFWAMDISRNIQIM